LGIVGRSFSKVDDARHYPGESMRLFPVLVTQGNVVWSWPRQVFGFW
jgi:hypothetical protein